MSKERTIRDHIQEMKSDYEKPPYQMENKPGRPKTWIREDQKMFDTEAYCLEVKKKLLQALQNEEIPLIPEMLFMHDAVFHEKDSTTAFEPIDNKKTWWEDEDYLRDMKVRDMNDQNLDPETKVERYLKGSEHDL